MALYQGVSNFTPTEITPMRLSPRLRRSLAFLALPAFLSLGACEQIASLTEPLNEDATLTIWTSDASPSFISVSVDGKTVGTLTQYRTSSPTCGATTSGGTISVTVSPGSHIITARETTSSGTWPAKSVSVNGGGCLTFELQQVAKHRFAPVRSIIYSVAMERTHAAIAAVALLSKDSATIAEVGALLESESTALVVHPDLASLLTSLGTVAPDVAVLDDRLSADAALEIRQMRRRQPSLYIVYIGAESEARSIVLLEAGADDAIVDGAQSLGPRLQSATRRARTINAGSRIALGDIVFDRENRRIWCAGREVSLTPHEFGVVDCLFWHAPRPVGVDTLADFVWGDNASGNRRTLVQVYVSYVRKKLANSALVVLRFARGEGYEFAPRGEADG